MLSVCETSEKGERAAVNHAKITNNNQIIKANKRSRRAIKAVLMKRDKHYVLMYIHNEDNFTRVVLALA